MRLGIARFGSAFRTFALCDGDDTLVALGGTVLDDPPANRRSDPFAILSGGCTDVGLIAEGPHPWAGLQTSDVLPGLMMMHPNWHTRPVGPLARDPKTLDRFVAALLDWAADKGLAALSFLYLTSAAQPLLRALASAGAAVVPLASSCVLDITWADFDGYLAAHSYKRRTAIRREQRHLAEQQVMVAEEDLAQAASELADLRCALVAKYGGTPRPEKERRMIAEIRERFAPEETLLVSARSQGRLVNFMLFVRESADWSAVLTGTDYVGGLSRFSYFSTGFYHPAARAPMAGIRRIHYGFGSWDAKVRRGCRKDPVWAAGLRLNAGEQSTAVASGVTHAG